MGHYLRLRIPVIRIEQSKINLFGNFEVFVSKKQTCEQILINKKSILNHTDGVTNLTTEKYIKKKICISQSTQFFRMIIIIFN